MKKVSFFFLGLLGLGLIVFNYSAQSKLSFASRESNAQLTNIHALQASAGEAYCDGSSTVTCTVEANGTKGTGTGQPHINW